MKPLPPARPHGPRCLLPARFQLSFGAAVGVGLLWPSVVCAAEAPRRSFDIPASDASATLKLFATQSHEQLLYGYQRTGIVQDLRVRDSPGAKV